MATWLTAALLMLQGASAAAAAPPAGNDPTQPKPKPAALAPHHTGQTTYGAPIQPAILHKRHKRSAADSPKPKMASRTNARHDAAGTKAAKSTSTKTANSKTANSKPADSKAADSRAPDSKAAADRSLPPDPAYRQPSESAAH